MAVFMRTKAPLLGAMFHVHRIFEGVCYCQTENLLGRYCLAEEALEDMLRNGMCVEVPPKAFLELRNLPLEERPQAARLFLEDPFNDGMTEWRTYAKIVDGIPQIVESECDTALPCPAKIATREGFWVYIERWHSPDVFPPPAMEMLNGQEGSWERPSEVESSAFLLRGRFGGPLSNFPHRPKSPSGLFDLVLYDTSDNVHIPVAAGVTWPLALSLWSERTRGGRMFVQLSHGTVYSIVAHRPPPPKKTGEKFCFVYKQRMSGIYHQCNDEGMPVCGSRVDTCALEITDKKPDGYDPCKRCFRRKSSE